MLATLLAIIGWVGLGLLLVGIAYLISRFSASVWTEQDTFGDVPWIHEEMRLARKRSGGDASEQGGRAGTDHGRTHDERAATS